MTLKTVWKCSGQDMYLEVSIDGATHVFQSWQQVRAYMKTLERITSSMEDCSYGEQSMELK